MSEKTHGGRPPVIPSNPKAKTTITLRLPAADKRRLVDAAGKQALQDWIMEAAFERAKKDGIARNSRSAVS